MSIVLEHLLKRYGGHPVVNNVSLEVADGEFFVLLGSSGSGKSTILRMIAGLAPIDSGRILLHGRDVTGLTPQRRDVGFVFQNYALFRHMTVADNIEFGLSVRKARAAVRRARRDELLELVGLAGLGGRMPHQLSGGQQQRVALARALAHQPKVLLLDEPFGALDAKIRIELRRTLRRIQQELHVTTIFVTHDQDEAFELADRIGVLSLGRLIEAGHPEELYLHPQTEFVATFLGSANLLVGQSTPTGVQIGPVQFPLNTEVAQIGDSQRVQVLFRPEDVAIETSHGPLSCPVLGQAQVESTSFVGSFERLHLTLPPLAGVRPIAPVPPFGSDSVHIEAVRPQDQAHRHPLKPGDSVRVGVRRIHALVHPGLSILLATDGTAQAQSALLAGAQLAWMAHARVRVVGYGASNTDALQPQLQDIKEQFGSNLPALDTVTTAEPLDAAITREAERQPYDLVVLGAHLQGDQELLGRVLQAGSHHLLLTRQEQPPPSRVLICVAAGEPAKDDVLFAGRLNRHLGAETTLLSVLPPGQDQPQQRARADRFLGASTRTLSLLGVSARAVIRAGAVREEILAEMREGSYDMLVLGAPLIGPDGRATLGGLVRELLKTLTTQQILIVRSTNAVRRTFAGSPMFSPISEEVIR